MSLDEEIRELSRAAGDHDLDAARRLVEILERERGRTAIEALEENVARVLGRVDALCGGAAGDSDVAWVAGDGESARRALRAAADADPGALVARLVAEGSERRPRMWLAPIDWDLVPEEGRVPGAALARISTEVDEAKIGLPGRVSAGGLIVPQGLEDRWPTPENEAINRLRAVERDLVRAHLSPEDESGSLARLRAGLPKRYLSAVLDVAFAMGRHLARKHGGAEKTVTFVLPHYMDDPKPGWVSSVISAARTFSSPALVHVVAVRRADVVEEQVGAGAVAVLA